ncbi:MAG: tRNA lysidine(34) synthetase TilS [Patescibacteria group bacterium]
MNIAIEPGTYVVAVSGGVDSMALLHLLAQKAKNQKSPAATNTANTDKSYRFVVAHFDHGIRGDSHIDRKLVQDVAKKYNLPFVHNRGFLGSDASEDQARRARYDFLHQVKEASAARGIITAHHQDDWLETAILQLIRGTQRLGVTSIAHNTHIRRPLLDVPKQQIKKYAKDQGLTWREDSTNQDLRYKRNYVRHKLVKKMSLADHERLLMHTRHLQHLNQEIDSLLLAQLLNQPAVDELDRQWFLSLDHIVAREFMAAWLRRNQIKGFDKKLIEQLVIRAKTLRPGQKTSITRVYFLQINQDNLKIISSHK